MGGQVRKRVRKTGPDSFPSSENDTEPFTFLHVVGCIILFHLIFSAKRPEPVNIGIYFSGLQVGNYKLETLISAS